MSGLIFGLPSRLPAPTAFLSPGQIRLPFQEQINSIAICCGVLRGLTEHQLSHAPETKAMPHEQALGEFMRQQLRPLARDGLLAGIRRQNVISVGRLDYHRGCREVGSPASCPHQALALSFPYQCRAGRLPHEFGRAFRSASDCCAPARCRLLNRSSAPKPTILSPDRSTLPLRHF